MLQSVMDDLIQSSGPVHKQFISNSTPSGHFVFVCSILRFAFSLTPSVFLMLLVEHQEGHSPCSIQTPVIPKRFLRKTYRGPSYTVVNMENSPVK